MQFHDYYLNLMAREYIGKRLKEARDEHLVKESRKHHPHILNKLLIYFGKNLIGLGERCMKYAGSYSDRPSLTT